MKGRPLVAVGVTVVLGLFALATWPAPGLAATLPPPATNQNAAWDGDFTVYSLPLSGIGVKSSPGNIKDGVVIYTGSGGSDVTTNFAGMDDAFAAVGGNCSNLITDPDCTFRALGTSPAPIAGMPNAADPGTPTDFTGDIDHSWDSTMAAMLGFLAGGNPLFFFNQNQGNAGKAQSNFCKDLGGGFSGSGVTDRQDICVYARVILSDSKGIAPDKVFEIEGPTRLFTDGPVAATNGSFNGPPGEPNEVLLAKGDVCLDSTGAEVLCSDPHTVGPINHNLGANDVAYLAESPRLNQALALCAALDPGCLWDTFRVQFMLLDLNNGFEQLFMFSTENIPPELIPAPAGLLLLGAGLIGFGARAWRRRRIA